MNVVPSIDSAWEYYRLYVQPRRVLENSVDDHGNWSLKYRRVALSEENRGELYPIFDIDVTSFSDFGIGIGIYYIQLLLYALLFLICGFVVIPSINIYSDVYVHENSYNNTITDELVRVAATCPLPTDVVATSGCGASVNTCTATFREDDAGCELYGSIIRSDLIMCVVFVVGVFCISFIENWWETELDEAVETAQDYSVMVADPPENALDADMWHKYFSRFGFVRNITIAKKNNEVSQILVKKYIFVKDFMSWFGILNIAELQGLLKHEERDVESRLDNGNTTDFQSSKPRSLMELVADYQYTLNSYDLSKYESFTRNALDLLFQHLTPETTMCSGCSFNSVQTAISPDVTARVDIKVYRLTPLSSKQVTQHIATLATIDQQLVVIAEKVYPVCRVYATFEMEACKRICLDALEVPDIEAYCGAGACCSSGKTTVQFENDVLDVVEPPEPSNVLWENLEVTDYHRRFRQLLSAGGSVLVLWACLLLVQYFSYSPTLVGIIVGLVDTILPFIFPVFTELELALDHDDMQDSLLIKLFVARILTSTVFSYIALKWSNFLDPSTIASVINIQIGASITAPLIAVLDLPGVFNRHIMPILFPLQTQNELNSCYFSGSAWLLAERYTGLGKVIFVALLFAILTPSGLFLASGACILIYWLDRYLIFRRWARVPMFDGQLGKRFRQQVLFAISCHMYVTLLFIYGWPFDSTVNHENGVSDSYTKVNKTPPLWILNVDKKPWQSVGQKEWIVPYKIATIIVLLITAYVIFGARIVAAFKKLFCSESDVRGTATCVPFCQVDGIEIYCPTVKVPSSSNPAEKQLIFADIENANKNHFSHWYKTKEEINLYNLSVLLPKKYWKLCLGTVYYYQSNEEKLLNEKNNEEYEVRSGSNHNKRAKEHLISKLSSRNMPITVEIELTGAEEYRKEDIEYDPIRNSKNNGKHAHRMIVKSPKYLHTDKKSELFLNFINELVRTQEIEKRQNSKINSIDPTKHNLIEEARAQSNRKVIQHQSVRARNMGQGNIYSNNSTIRNYKEFKEWIDFVTPNTATSHGNVILRTQLYAEVCDAVKKYLETKNTGAEIDNLRVGDILTALTEGKY